MINRTIQVTVSDISFEMSIEVPDSRDEEEYIDELFDRILNDECKYSVDWDFIE